MNFSEDFKKEAKKEKCRCIHTSPSKSEEEFSKRIKNVRFLEMVRIINRMDLNTGKPRGGPN